MHKTTARTQHMNELLESIRTTPFGHAMRRHWRLEPEMHFLNHGSFGATPRSVLAAQQHWRDHMEAQPVRFMADELSGLLRDAAAVLAKFLGAQPERLAFVENATDAVNAVLRSFAWRAGDEIVIANHAYPAVRNTVRFVAERYKLTVREAEIPFPLDMLHARETITAAFAQAISPRTRLLIVDHVCSPLAIVLPVADIVGLCRQHNVQVLVDGAHAPGMLDLKLDELGADWYTGNCHKWLFAPKSCAFLYASPAGTAGLHPTAISNFFGAGFPTEFDWQGTRDYSAWLAVTAALSFIDALGVQRYSEHLRVLATDAATLIADRWQVDLPAPVEQFAAMVTLPLPIADAATADNARRWHQLLWQAHRIEVPVQAFNGRLWVRISAQVYNELLDYEALADVFG